MKRDQQITGNIGLYWTCYRLSLLGWNAMPTSRNAKGVDIIAYNHDYSRMISIQVKTLSKRDAVPLGTSLDRIMGDFWVVVNNVIKSPEAYVLLASEVREFANRNEKDSRISFWLEPPSYCVDKFREAWDRFGEAD